MSYFPNVFVEIFTSVDGLPTWTNIGGDIETPIKCNLGFTDGDHLSRLAPGSDMRFSLNNRNSTYDPSSTFYKGQKIRLRVKYGSLVKTKFFGYIDSIGLDVGTWGQRQAHVVAIDWLALAAKTPVRAIPGMTNTTIDLAVTRLLQEMQIQPEAIDFEVGAITLPYVFDQITPNSTIYSELQNLVMGEWGYIYMRDGGETLKIENSLSRTGDGSDYKTTSYYLPDGVAEDFLLEDGTNFLLEDGTNFLLEGEPTAGSFDSNLGEEYTDLKINHGDNLVNKILASAVPVVVGGSTVVIYPFDIASGSKAILVPTNNANIPYILQGQYKDPTAGGAQISGSSIVTPVVSTDWRFNSKADGTGSDLSANLSITFSLGVSGFKAIIVNTGAPGYITRFNIRGVPVYRYAPVETIVQDQRSIWDYGDYSLQFTRQYGSNSDDIQPFMFRMIMRDRKPRTIFSDPKFNAFDEIDHLAGFLALDIGDQIRLASTKPESDALYYIQGVRFTIEPGSEAITFDYVTTETLGGAVVGVTEIALDMDRLDDYVNFGYVPILQNMTQKSICMRVQFGSTASAFNVIQLANFFRVGLTTTNRLEFSQDFTGTDGVWRNTIALSDDTWYNIVILYDSSLTSNVPVIYIDGSSVSVSTIATPTGTSELGVGESLYLQGNSIIESICFYNRILTPAEIATIHNGGAHLPFASYPATGLKFFFGGMDSDEYTSKLNTVLGSLDTVYDLVYGFTGQPVNMPILRAVG